MTIFPVVKVDRALLWFVVGAGVGLAGFFTLLYFSMQDTKHQETVCRQHSGVLVLATRGEYACVLGAQ